MLAGDFTTVASPACTGGRQINLGGGFVNNRINPALFSPAAMRLAQRLPRTDDPAARSRIRRRATKMKDRGSGDSTTS